MIRKVNIRSFGSFQSYTWGQSEQGNNQLGSFQKFNLLFGRNYSGKTTLSRIFRSVEQATVPDGIENPEFEFETSSGTLTSRNITNHTLKIRVYNKDYVKENLSFLVDDSSGGILPFALLGSKNVEIEQDITKIETELGSVDAKSGLSYSLSQKGESLRNHKAKLQGRVSELESLLSKFASQSIKHDSDLGNPNYNKTHLLSDIQKLSESQSEGHESEQSLRQLINEPDRATIESLDETNFALCELVESVKKFVSEEVFADEAVSYLENNPMLQSWVRQGMPLHRNKLEFCAFCSNTFKSDQWERLDGHFNDAFEEHERQGALYIKKVNEEIARQLEWEAPDTSLFYETDRLDYESKLRTYEAASEKYLAKCRSLIDVLHRHISGISDPFTTESYDEVVLALDAARSEIQECISRHNSKCASVLDTKVKAKKRLRMRKVFDFVRDSGYFKLTEDIAAKKMVVSEMQNEYSDLESRVHDCNQKLIKLKASLSNESTAAEKVNEFLALYFGHQALELRASPKYGEEGVEFKIYRNGSEARMLSEGECSLISFCYFMAQVSPELVEGSDLILFIDDPISSLDSNHVFCLFSLIETFITEKKSYGQLFLSTHNLEFFNYSKKLTRPSNDVSYILIENISGTSILRSMPKYLRKYSTEFVYLFEQIYLAANMEESNNDDDNYYALYSFGNNLRKFLETILYYKYPDYGTVKEKLKLFFDDTGHVHAAVFRLNNEYSHLEDIFDRALVPIDVPEMKSLASYVLRTLERKDRDQYNAFLRAIGVEAGADA